MAHNNKEPIFVTKNGYSDLVIMSTEMYEQFAQINRIDKAIEEAEREIEQGAKPISVKEAKKKLDRKYYG